MRDEVFAAHWPYAGDEEPIGTAFTRAARYVLARGDPLDWANSHRRADIDAVKALTAEA